MPIVPCAPTPIVKGIVTFDPSIFTDADHYPEFVAVPTGQLNFNFLRAQLLLNNSCGSRVCDANARETMLDLLVAHLTFLTNGIPPNTPAPGIVGRINSATEGSVSVSAEYSSNVSQSEAFYIQSKYGALYWEMTAQYRTGVYIPPPQSGCIGPFSGNLGPLGNGFPGWNGGSS